MTAFEISVLVLLVLILFKPDKASGSSREATTQELINLLSSIEQNTRLHRLEQQESSACLSSLEDMASKAYRHSLPPEEPGPP